MDYYRIQETQVFQVQPQIEIIYSSKRNVYIIVYGFDNINKKMACVMLMILISEDYISSAYHKNIDDLYDMYPILPHTFYGEYQGILMNRLCFSTRYRSLHSIPFDNVEENYTHVLHKARDI